MRPRGGSTQQVTPLSWKKAGEEPDGHNADNVRVMIFKDDSFSAECESLKGKIVKMTEKDFFRQLKQGMNGRNMPSNWRKMDTRLMEDHTFC